MTKPFTYRAFIDEMVSVCRDGQGQIGARRAEEGIWNRNASAEVLPEQHAINVLLARLSPAERRVLAGMLAQEVVTGVFETLKALEAFKVPPFETGYEGSPFNDFVGRLDGWDWPEGNAAG
jgi:hypothetical protein